MKTMRWHLVLCTAALVSACGDSSTTGRPKENEGAPARREALRSIAENVILPTYREFAERARELKTATAAFAADPSDDKRTAARVAWTEAAALWQRAELFQVGPAGVAGETAGGKDLRDDIYAWPLLKPCLVDQTVVSKGYEAAGFGDGSVSARTLSALEYLLFSDTEGNACAANAEINTGGTWAALDSGELRSRRAAYAAKAAELVHAAADELVIAWEPSGGAFLESFATGGAGSMVYATSQDTLNALTDALFYLEDATKDMKLGAPAGITGCSDDVCPDLVESPYASRSKEHIAENLRGFQLVFLGGEASASTKGIDNLLSDASAGALADDVAAKTASAISAVEALDGTLETALVSEYGQVETAYAALRDLVVLMKTELVSVLDLELPARVEADND